MMRWAFLIGMSVVALPQARAAELVVRVGHVVSDRGTIRIAVDRTESGYRADGVAFRQGTAVARMPEVSVSFPDIPTGRYAIKVYQDENGDGRLNRNLFGAPAEPFGFSNNARARFSMPPFEAVRIEVKQPRSLIRIDLAGE
jgi:uncharacterized protein (DUF2141 family)